MNIEAINQDLNALRIGVSVEIQGKRVYLRATLPPKPETGRAAPHRQRIAALDTRNFHRLPLAKASAQRLTASMVWTQRVPEFSDDRA